MHTGKSLTKRQIANIKRVWINRPELQSGRFYDTSSTDESDDDTDSETTDENSSLEYQDSDSGSSSSSSSDESSTTMGTAEIEFVDIADFSEENVSM